MTSTTVATAVLTIATLALSVKAFRGWIYIEAHKTMIAALDVLWEIDEANAAEVAYRFEQLAERSRPFKLLTHARTARDVVFAASPTAGEAAPAGPGPLTRLLGLAFPAAESLRALDETRDALRCAAENGEPLGRVRRSHAFGMLRELPRAWYRYVRQRLARRA